MDKYIIDGGEKQAACAEESLQLLSLKIPVFGMVKDEDNNPLSGVTVSVADITGTTDAMGNFRIEIPLEKQNEEQRVCAFKGGYKLWDFTGPVSDKVPWKIILRR